MTSTHSLEELFNTIEQLRKLIQSQAQESYEEKTATFIQFLALTYVADHDTCTVGEIAQYLKLSKSSATQLVERLVKADDLKRADDAEDGRVVRLSISIKGQQEISRLRKKFTEKVGKIFSKIPERDIQELVRIHKNLIESLQTE